MPKKALSIPSELYAAIELRLAQSDFSSVDEYAEYVLDQVIKKTEMQNSENGQATKQQEEEVKERLKGLGYLE